MAAQDFVIELSKFKIAEPIWPLKFDESLHLTENWYTGVFEVVN